MEADDQKPAPEAAVTEAVNKKLKWYVVHTYSGFEQKAKKSLEVTQQQYELASEQLVRRLVADGMPFSIDVSTRHFELSLEGVPLVFASGPDDPSEAVEPLIARFRAAGARQIVITCGKRGSFYDDGGSVTEAGSVPVDVVDTCGAGDSFIATFITSRFFAERSGRAALDLAAERASETCTHLGGFPQPILAIPQWLLAKYDDVIRGTQRTGT